MIDRLPHSVMPPASDLATDTATDARTERCCAERPAAALVVGIAVLGAIVPFLAVAPHSGDGLELVVTARQGGVLHPPGFPVQAWLGRLAAQLPIEDARPLSLLSAAGHAVAAALVYDMLSRLRVALCSRLLGVSLFACFPACLAVGTQPEAFGLAHACLAMCLHLGVMVSCGALRGARAAVVIGLVGGLALAQHPITVIAAPAGIVAALRVARAGPRSTAVLLGVTAATFVLTAAGLYGSLLLLARSSTWPNWGQLHDSQDVLLHFLRVDYGVIDLSPRTGAVARHGLDVAAEQIMRAWGPGVLLAGPALAVLARERRAAAVALGGSLVAGLLLLARMREPGDGDVEIVATLERFVGVAVLPGALLVAVGAEHLSARAGRLARVLRAAILVTAVSLILPCRDVVAAAQDRTLEVLLDAAGRSLPADAVFLGATDLDVFGGVPAPGGRRFPLAIVSDRVAERYRLEVVPVIEPRLRDVEPEMHAWSRAALARGWMLAALTEEVLPPDVTSQLRGLWMVAGAGVDAESSDDAISAAVALCPAVSPFEALPEPHHGRLRTARRFFARAYEAAAYREAADGRLDDARRTSELARAVAAAVDPPAWRAGCDAFVARHTRLGQEPSTQ